MPFGTIINQGPAKMPSPSPSASPQPLTSPTASPTPNPTAWEFRPPTRFTYTGQEFDYTIGDYDYHALR